MAGRIIYLKEAFKQQVELVFEKINIYCCFKNCHRLIEIPTYQANNAWPMNGFCQEKWEVAHHVDDQRLDDSRFFGELKEESGQATNDDPDCLLIDQFTQIRIKVFK